MDYKEEAAALNRKEVGTVSAACVCQPQMCCVGLCLWQLDRDESETEEGRRRRVPTLPKQQKKEREKNTSFNLVLMGVCQSSQFD